MTKRAWRAALGFLFIATLLVCCVGVVATSEACAAPAPPRPPAPAVRAPAPASRPAPMPKVNQPPRQQPPAKPAPRVKHGGGGGTSWVPVWVPFYGDDDDCEDDD